MPLIIDPDDLNDHASNPTATEVFIDTGDRTIALNEVGNLSTDGATLKALYSFLKEEWKNDPHTKSLAAFPFPMVPITDESFEFVDGWDFFDNPARFLVRTGGWTVRNLAGAATQMWAGIITLGNIDGTGQVYYDNASGRIDFELTGAVNQAIQILRDDNGNGNTAEGSDFDRRSQTDVYIREFEKTYARSTLADIGVTTLAPISYRFPLANGTDLNIIETDGNVNTNSPYTQIVLRYFAAAYSRAVDTPGTPRDFGVVIDVGTHSGIDGDTTAAGATLTSAEGGIHVSNYDGGTLTIHEGTNAGLYDVLSTTATTVVIDGTFGFTLGSQSFTVQRAAPVVASLQEIYTKIQYQLRQTSDIDATGGAVITGNIADEIMRFIGPNLQVGSTTHDNPEGPDGVIIEGFSAADTNNLSFYDNTDTLRTYPFVAALVINFGANLQSDGAAEYWIYFTYTHAYTNTGFAITSASGQTATLTSTTTDLSEVLNDEEFLVSGFTDPGNNGLYRATAGGIAGSVAVEKADTGDGNFVNEIAGDSVTLQMNPFGSSSAIIVDDNDVVDMVGAANVASANRSFNYDGNVQGGRTASTPAAITAVGIGLNTGQYVRAAGTIAQSTANSVSLVAALERNYQNL